MLLIPPTWLENSTAHNAQDYRVMLASVVSSPGVAAPGACRVTERAGTASMSVDVAPGGAFVASTRAVQQGMYHAYNTGTLNVPLAASDGSNPRIDRILIQVRDEAQDAGLSDNDVRIYIEQGTPAAVPELPAITVEDYIELARVTVPAGATAITDSEIEDRRQLAGIAQVNDLFPSLSRGQAHYYELTTTGPSFSDTETNLMVTSFVADPTRIYRIEAYARIESSASDDVYVALRLRDDKTTRVDEQAVPLRRFHHMGHAITSRRVFPSGGAVQLRMTGQRVNGTATLNRVSSAINPAFILVEDIGAV